jgi:hypothetical protein
MKLALTLGFSILLSQLSFSQKILTDEYEQKITLNDFRLKGKVKKVISTATDSNGNSATLPLYENEYYDQVSLEFNEKGLLDKRVNYLDYRGKLGVYNYVDYVYKTSYLLDNQVNTIVNNGEDPKRVASNKSYYYDNKNQVIKLIDKVEGRSSKSTYETNFIYSNRLDKIVTKVENSISTENNLTYNKNGFLVLNESTSFDGKKGRKSYYLYDNKTPIYKEEIAGSLSSITFYDKGSISKIQSFDTDKNLNYEALYNSNNEIESLKTQSFIGGKSTLTNYKVTYDYDEKGNWIKAKITSNGVSKFNVNRSISYF